MGDERAHAARAGKRQRLAVVGLAELGIEPVGMVRDIAEQVVRMGGEPGVRWRVCERAVAQAQHLVEPAEQQGGPTERKVGLPVEADDAPRRLTLEELLALPESGQRLACLADLREDPGGGSDRVGKVEDRCFPSGTPRSRARSVSAPAPNHLRRR